MSEKTSSPLPRRLQDLSGKRYGRLTVLRFDGWHTFPKSRRESMWECLCDCGNLTRVYRNLMVKGKTRSCGCLERENRFTMNVTHGGTIEGKREHLYDIWCGIKQRCYDPNSCSYARYGARGITVLWKSYEEFRKDMADDYKPGLTIERKDNDGPYSKENCRWATRKEQSNNRRNNHRVSHEGVTMTIAQWAGMLKLPQNKLWYHLVIRKQSIPELAAALGHLKT